MYLKEAPCREVLEKEALLREEALVEAVICTGIMSLVKRPFDTGLVEETPRRALHREGTPCREGPAQR